MAAQDAVTRRQQVSTQADVATPFDDLCERLEEKGKTELLEVFTKCKDIYEDNGQRLNLDTLNKICKSYNKTKPTAATFGWKDDDLDILEKLSNEKITVDNEDTVGKVYNDPVHGNIIIHPVCQAIIDTPQFQRLRDLKQMGMVSHVYPGAVHTRFEHSLGVCYLAGEFARTLQRNQPFLGITKEEVLCVQIAGLCHDLGHGPFSHLFDEIVQDLDKEKFSKHEERSVALLEHLIKCNKSKLAESFKKYNLWDDTSDGGLDDLLFKKIKEMISTEGKEGRHTLKHFLYDIVSNDSTGVDVDKFDYLSRDSLHLGMKNNFDHRRFMMFARVNFINGVGKICVRDKELTNLYNMYITRYTHQKFVWNHHVNKCAELMMSDVIKLAAGHLKIESQASEGQK